MNGGATVDKEKDIQELIEKYKETCRIKKKRIITSVIKTEAIFALVVYGLFAILRVLNTHNGLLVCVAIIAAMLLIICLLLAMLVMPFSGYEEIHKIISADAITEFVESIGEKTFVKIQGPPLKFRLGRTLDVDCVEGGKYIGVLSLTPQSEAGILTSMYGSDGPDIMESMDIDIPLSPEGAKQWTNTPEPDNIRLPYIYVSLFDIWEFVMPCAADPEDIRDAFDAMCRAVAYDLVKKRLLDAIDKKKPIEEEYYTRRVLASYFKKDIENVDEDTKTAISRLREIVQPLIVEQKRTIKKYMRIGAKNG